MKIKKLFDENEMGKPYGSIRRFICPSGKCGKWDIIAAVSSVALALFCMAVVIYYICGPMEGYLHSDYTDTIYWANASFESGKVFDPNFVYAGLLPFSANLWMMPLIAVFGLGMTAHKIGMIIYMLLLVLAIYFMCRSFKWSISWTALTVSAMLMLLSGSDKLREMMWGHVIYYSLAILLLCVGLGLAARVSEMDKPPKTKGIIILILGALFIIGTATNGFQLIALVTLPTLAVLFFEVFLDPTKKLFDKSNTAAISSFVAVIGLTLIGMLVLNAVKGDIKANYTDTYSWLKTPDTWVNNLLSIPKEWFSLVGISISGPVRIFTREGIEAIFYMLIGIVIAVMPVVGLISYRKITDKGVRALIIAHFTVSAVIIFGYTCGYIGGLNWRLLPMMGSGVLASVATAKHLFITKRTEPSVQRRISCLLVTAILLGVAFNLAALTSMPYNYGRNNDLHKLAQELEDRGLEYGYASFWYSQSITLLSDSKVKTRMIIADEEEGVTTDYYQNSVKWYEDQPDADRYFLLLTLSENSTATKCDDWLEYVAKNAVEKEYLFDRYVLYVFEENLTFPDPQLFGKK